MAHTLVQFTVQSVVGLVTVTSDGSSTCLVKVSRVCLAMCTYGCNNMLFQGGPADNVA